MLNEPLPMSTGFSTRSNIGEVENRGIELILNTVNVDSKDFMKLNLLLVKTIIKF